MGRRADRDPASIRSLVADLRRTPRPARRPFPDRRTVRSALRSLKEARQPPTPTGHPWIPESLVSLFDETWEKGIHWYVAVDDIDEGVTVFSATPWPTLDERHRLVFQSEKSTAFHVPIEHAQAFVETHRFVPAPTSPPGSGQVPLAMSTRPLRVGDVFALSNGGLQMLRDPEARPRARVLVIDVTSEARVATKVAFYAAASATIDPDVSADRELAEVVWKERRTHEGGEQEA